MSSAQDDRNESRKFARLAATMLFMLALGIGYSVSPPVEGAVDEPAMEEQGSFPAACATGGLAFSGCFLD